MDEFMSVSPIPGSTAFDQLLHSPMGNPGPPEFTEGSSSYLTSILNDELTPTMIQDEKYNPNTDSMVPTMSYVNQDHSMMYPMPQMDNMAYSNETTSCDQCGAIVNNNQDAIMTHLQQCCVEEQVEQLSVSNSKKVEKKFLEPIQPATIVHSSYNGDDQVLQVKWDKYSRTLQVKMAPDYNFSTKSYTFEVPGLDPGMKLEAIDKNNPQSFCVATVVEVLGHRVRIRYDGYGRDSSNDFWCNFQAEELYPIGWCAQNAFPLQPPVGINCTLEEWRNFLTQTLTGALAAPKHLFPSEHYQPKVHAFENGMKLEVIHPSKPYIFCAATVVKSLGPYYFLVATDKLDGLPSVTMCCHSDSSNIFPVGWSYKNGIEFTVPSGYTRKSFSWEKYITAQRASCAPQHLFKKSKSHKFRAGQKLEAVDLEHPHLIRVATITNVMGRVLQLFFDGSQTRFQFVLCDSPDIHGFGWCKRTGHPLHTPYGKMPFKTVVKYEGLESCPKRLKLISFTDVIGRKQPSANLATHPNIETQTEAATSHNNPPATNIVSNLVTHGHLSNNARGTTRDASVHPSTPHTTPTHHLATHHTHGKHNQTAPNSLATHPNLSTHVSATPHHTAAHSIASPSNETHCIPETAPSMLAASSSMPDQPYPQTPSPGPDYSAQDMSVTSPVEEVDDNSEDKEKCPTLSPSDDDEDLSDEDGSGTGPERFYHNKNQIYFNKTCCCGPLLNPEEVKLLPDATDPGKVSSVIRIGLEMVAKCAKDPERVLEMMQEGSGVRLTIKHNGKTFKKAISRVDSRPKLERYLKRFCRRLVCCEYFLSLTPVASPCPDECKADQYGNLQGPKGMKAKRAREYFETKHLGYEKKKRGRRSKAVANEAAAQRAAAGIVTSVFHKGNHVPLPNLSLPVTAIADHLRNTATKILHQVQANQGILHDRSMFHSKAATSSVSMVTQTTPPPSSHHPTPYPSVPPQHTTHHPSTPHSSTPNTSNNLAHHSTPPLPTAGSLPTSVSSSQSPTYGKPRLLPSPYGPPPLPITTVATENDGATTGNGRGSYRGIRSLSVPSKKSARPIIPAGPIPERNQPKVGIYVPPANKLPLPASSTAIPATTMSVPSETGSPSFHLAQSKFITHTTSSEKVASSFSSRMVGLPQTQCSGDMYAPSNHLNNSNQTTTLVTANQHPIPASIPLTRAGPPPLIPARAISGTPSQKGVQMIRLRPVEGKSAAPNVCVTERGTFVATQANKTSIPSSGACVMNHVVGQSADANAMMNRMFSVVRSNDNGASKQMASRSGFANASHSQTTQVARVYPSVKNENDYQSTNCSHQHAVALSQNTSMPNQITMMPHQNAGTRHQNTNIQSNDMSNQSTYASYQSAKKFDRDTKRRDIGTEKYDRNANMGSQNTIQKFSINVGGGMGAVTTAVRSGMLAREKYQPRDASRDTKHLITQMGGYNVKINKNNLETKHSDTTPKLSDGTPAQSDISLNITDVTPTACEISPTGSEEIPMLSDIPRNGDDVENEGIADIDDVPINKRGSTWMYRRRKKKKVRFTYVKGKKNKKKELESEMNQYEFDENGGFLQEFDDEDTEQFIRKGKKREHDDDDDKNDPPYAPPRAKEISPKRLRRSSDLAGDHVTATPGMTSSCVTSPKAELMKGVLHAVQSSQHPSVKLRSPNEKQLHSFNGFSSPPKKSRVHATDSAASRKGGASFSSKTGAKSHGKLCANAATNTSFPGCSSDKCLYHPDNPRKWNVDQVGEYIMSTDCKNYATYFMDQEIDGESLLLLTRSTLMQFTNMKLGPTLKLSNYIAQLRARVGMSKRT